MIPFLENATCIALIVTAAVLEATEKTLDA